MAGESGDQIPRRNGPPADCIRPRSSGEEPVIKIGDLGQVEPKEALSLLAIPAANAGAAGAKLAIADNNTTGKFLNQTVQPRTDPAQPSDEAPGLCWSADHGISLVLLDLPAEDVLKLADAGQASGTVFFNVGRGPMTVCARKTAAPMLSTQRQADRCWPTDLANTSFGNSGAAGCW